MKKELTPQQKADLKMKYEIAEELRLLDKISENGWKGLTSRKPLVILIISSIMFI